MQRYEIVQQLLNANGRGTYLEIGVEYGKSFIPIKANRKIGVDPDFRKLMSIRSASFFKSWENLYFQMTSNEFFSSHSDLFSDRLIDVAFIDGAHTNKQSLEDVLNCLEHLNTDGFIVVHDCNPATPAMAYPAESYQAAGRTNPSGWTGEWCGNVWKTIVNLRSSRDDLEIFVLDCDYGVGVIHMGNPESMLPRHLKTDTMTYEDFEKQRHFFLNLKKPEYLTSFLRRTKREEVLLEPTIS